MKFTYLVIYIVIVISTLLCGCQKTNPNIINCKATINDQAVIINNNIILFKSDGIYFIDTNKRSCELKKRFRWQKSINSLIKLDNERILMVLDNVPHIYNLQTNTLKTVEQINNTNSIIFKANNKIVFMPGCIFGNKIEILNSKTEELKVLENYNFLTTYLDYFYIKLNGGKVLLIAESRKDLNNDPRKKSCQQVNTSDFYLFDPETETFELLFKDNKTEYYKALYLKQWTKLINLDNDTIAFLIPDEKDKNIVNFVTFNTKLKKLKTYKLPDPLNLKNNYIPIDKKIIVLDDGNLLFNTIKGTYIYSLNNNTIISKIKSDWSSDFIKLKNGNILFYSSPSYKLFDFTHNNQSKIYNYKEKKFYEAPNLAVSRSRESKYIILDNNKIFFWGGDVDTSGYQKSIECEIYSTEFNEKGEN